MLYAIYCMTIILKLLYQRQSSFPFIDLQQQGWSLIYQECQSLSVICQSAHKKKKRIEELSWIFQFVLMKSGICNLGKPRKQVAMLAFIQVDVSIQPGKSQLDFLCNSFIRRLNIQYLTILLFWQPSNFPGDIVGCRMTTKDLMVLRNVTQYSIYESAFQCTDCWSIGPTAQRRGILAVALL